MVIFCPRKNQGEESERLEREADDAGFKINLKRG